MDIKETVRRFVVENFMLGAGDRQLGDEDSFLERHLIDSTGFIELVSFLEETFGVTIDDQDMVPENLDSLVRIERFISAKVPA
jgi:acyl carrier protein